MAGSETPIRGSLFNKVASVTAWKDLTVLERDPSKREFREILRKLFCRTPASNHFSHDVVFFLFVDQWGFQPPQFIWWSNGKLGEGIYKSVQCCVVMEIRWKLHSQVVATHVPNLPLEVEEKEEVKNLLKCCKFSFYVVVDNEVFTYLKNKK